MTIIQKSPPRLKMTGISKNFKATVALNDVDFELISGEVHALLGENGAGKSTLVKILSGAVNPDKGTILLDGKAFQPDNPLESRKKGISMIYQELNLAPHMTVMENVMLGREIVATDSNFSPKSLPSFLCKTIFSGTPSCKYVM